MTEKKPTRKSTPAIKVYCLPEERAVIEENAKAVGKSVSSFLLAVGQGYKVTGVMDYERVIELSKINGDLGRLGGLLKWWLSGDARADSIDDGTIRAVLRKIESKQDEMAKVMMSVVRPKAKR